MDNLTTVTEFFLMGFSDLRDVQVAHFVVFLAIYLVALAANFIIISTVIQNQRLHSPMYFFLVNLSFLDACYISTTVPKSTANSITNSKLISYSGCVTQVFLVLLFAGSELGLLTVMAYDRYVAICYPLQYGQIMNWNACFQMAATAWFSGTINAVLHTANTFSLRFCSSNFIQQFFCDMPQLISMSCSDTQAVIWLIFASGFLGSLCFGLVIVSYGYIFSAVFKIRSVQARYKTFSTCIPHLTVFCLFLSTAMFSYFRPKSWSSPAVDLLSAVLYTVLPPLMNPIIYCLRNREIQAILLKMIKKGNVIL